MNTIYSREEIKSLVTKYKTDGKTVGFVPTMGALHDGHLKLVSKAVAENDIAICSIFVNPTQFNNPSDLAAYPRTLSLDLQKLESVGCQVVFAPTTEEMYQVDDKVFTYDFGEIAEVMEGIHRPGHFNGMATIVHKLLEYIPANKAYFGLKDYQQLLIVKELVKRFNLVTEIVPCQIVRERDGLAMSSRNLRLSEKQRISVPLIFSTLNTAKDLIPNLNPTDLKNWIIDKINSDPELKVEYVEVADGKTLKNLEKWADSNNPVIFAVVFAGDVRLIDNLQLN